MTSCTVRPFVYLCLLGALLIASPLAGATYVLPSDEALFDQATHVAEVVILKDVTPALPFAVATDYFAVARSVLKGEISSADIVVRLPGGRTAEGLEVQVDGVPIFREGEELLLFLVENDDGSFGVLHLALGAFRSHRVGNRTLALRDLGDAVPLGSADPSSSDRVRDFDAFADWLRDRAAGSHRPVDYFRSAPEDGSGWLYNLIRVNGRNIRWFEFDTGQKVLWRTNSASSFGSVSLFSAALGGNRFW